jgi:hypothetical protein
MSDLTALLERARALSPATSYEARIIRLEGMAHEHGGEAALDRMAEAKAKLDARPGPLLGETMDYGEGGAQGDGDEDVPPELAVLMEADETLDAARARFYAEYQRLRSLFVGNLYMDDAMLDRWKRLGAKASRAWLRITD